MITNGLGSAAGAGLGEFFDFEISGDALMDEMMVHGGAKPSHPHCLLTVCSCRSSLPHYPRTAVTS